MVTLLKLVRLLLTGLAALLALFTLFSDGLTGLLISMLPISVLVGAMWIVPLMFRKPKPKPAKHTDFDPSIAHDNIALDTGRNVLWIRDASGAERYVRTEELLAWRTNSDRNDGHFRQRLELDVSDVQRPRWNVLFQRHSDRRIKSSRINTAERDEWFARIRAWSQEAASHPGAQDAKADQSLPALHAQYYQAENDLQRQNYLVAFDISCSTDSLDQKTQWERLGGDYPGPSPDLQNFRKRA